MFYLSQGYADRSLIVNVLCRKTTIGVKKRHLFPFGNEAAVCVALVQAELVELFRYLVPAVIKVIDIATPLMREFEDWPQGFTLSLAIMFIHLSCVTS